jgi:lipoate-protein ligase A
LSSISYPTHPVSDATPCRVIVDDQPASGAWNMAVDEALLESVVAGGPCTVRWYGWDLATLSIGYFQTPDEARRDPRFARLPVVRRLTGGGAIVHHHELTYSCTVPAGHALSGNARQLYFAVHERIIQVLAGFGFTAMLRGSAEARLGKEFLCFGRGDDFDVVMEGRKVLGSAQRRRKGAILQHGSLLLWRSEHATEFAGIFDCAAHAVAVADLREALSRAVGGLFSSQIERSSMSPEEGARATQLMQPGK